MNSDDKRIGRNIKAIRNANNKNYLEFAEMIGISDSALQKIENGTRHATDEIIMIIAKATNCSFNDIKYGDLTFLDKNDLYFGESMDFLSFLKEDGYELNEIGLTILEKTFPILSNGKSFESENFRNGFQIAREKIQKNICAPADYIHAIKLFLHATSEGVDAIAYVNALSCFGYYYTYYVKIVFDNETTNHLIKTQISSFADFINGIFSSQNQGLMMKRKKEFLESYNSILTKLMSSVANSKEYDDYAYYYLWVRYSIGMLDEDEIKLDEDQMKIYSESLFECLWKMGNKYAVDLHNYIEADK